MEDGISGVLRMEDQGSCPHDSPVTESWIHRGALLLRLLRLLVHCPPSDRAGRKSAGHLQNRAPGRSFIMQHGLIVSVAEYNRLDIIRLSRYDPKAS